MSILLMRNECTQRVCFFYFAIVKCPVSGTFMGCGTIGTLLVTLGWDARHTNVTVGGASADSGT